MAKVEIIRNFLVASRGELPPSREAVKTYIDDVTRTMNFLLTQKQKQDLLNEFAPEEEKKPKRGPKTDGTTESPAETE